MHTSVKLPRRGLATFPAMAMSPPCLLALPAPTGQSAPVDGPDLAVTLVTNT